MKNLLADPNCQAWHRGHRYWARATVLAPRGQAEDLAGDLAVEIYRDRLFYTKLIYLAVGERVHAERDVRRLSVRVVPVLLEERGPFAPCP